MVDKFKSRKFVLTAATLLAIFVALFLGKLTGDQATLLIPATLTIFTGGNVAAKHKSFTEGV